MSSNDAHRQARTVMLNIGLEHKTGTRITGGIMAPWESYGYETTFKHWYHTIETRPDWGRVKWVLETHCLVCNRTIKLLIHQNTFALFHLSDCEEKEKKKLKRVIVIRSTAFFALTLIMLSIFWVIIGFFIDDLNPFINAICWIAISFLGVAMACLYNYRKMLRKTIFAPISYFEKMRSFDLNILNPVNIIERLETIGEGHDREKHYISFERDRIIPLYDFYERGNIFDLNNITGITDHGEYRRV